MSPSQPPPAATGPWHNSSSPCPRKFVQGGLGDLRDARRRVILKCLPGVLVDLLDRRAYGGVWADADRELPAGAVEPVEGLVRPEPRVGAQQLGSARAGAPNARDQLVAE